ncbi:MAG: biopolymer transporter ExbD, partial [Saprospiraceae bacterium]|nr:biopolymer transporter ExbD [Saprospiraceae bacterium]
NKWRNGYVFYDRYYLYFVDIFMMVSTLVNPSALNLALPGNAKTSKKPVKSERLDDIGITASGNFILNSATTPIEKIRLFLEAKRAKNISYQVTVSPDTKAPVEKVVQVLDMTQSLDINSILQADAD